MTNKFLLPTIREVGGAYGAGAVVGDGSFSFFSYRFYFEIFGMSFRDPNVKNTFENFEKSVQSVIEGDYSEKALEEAKVKCIGNVNCVIMKLSSVDHDTVSTEPEDT